jgi:glucose uptake protein
MWIPTTYAAAMGIMLLSMLCWGSWDNTQKLDKTWRFELFYWDYMWGLLACALIAGLTLGRIHAAAPGSLFHDLAHAGGRAWLEAFLGGAIFNVGNLLLVAAISIAGMAVAFPLGSGLALVIGASLNYAIAPAGNPRLLFGGILLICGAIVADALAYRRLARGRGAGAKTGAKGIALSLACGVVLGLFYPLVAKAMSGPRHFGPYAVFLVFALGALASNIPANYALMRRPVVGAPLTLRNYFQGRARQHGWGIAGGLIWGVGTISSFAASSVPLVGPAASFSMSQGNTMISALWGVFVWHEFRGAGRGVCRLLALMFALFVAGLTAIALAPILR